MTSDPIGLQGGINSYSYTYSNPLVYIDPMGLEVSGVFDLSGGTFTVTDLDTGATETAEAFSGNVHWNDPAYANAAGKNTGPLILGPYEILDHPSGLVKGKTWFDLDFIDGIRDDYNPNTKRGKFRLHEGTASDGCITVVDDKSPLDYHGNPNLNRTPGSPNSKSWQRIKNIIEGTKASTVKDAFGRSRQKYGTIRVVP